MLKVVVVDLLVALFVTVLVLNVVVVVVDLLVAVVLLVIVDVL